MAKGDLHKKLLAIAGDLGKMQKDSTNTQQHYKYVSAEAFIEAVRAPMLAHGVLIMPRITATWERQDTKNSTGTAAHTHAVYVITDGVEEVEVSVPGQGWDSLDKAVYKALTGGFKYLLRMVFMLPMEDDPEKDTGGGGQQSEYKGPPNYGASPPQQQGGGGVEPKSHADTDGFAMGDTPTKKDGTHIFAKAEEYGKPEGAWNGWTWEQLAKAHGAAMRRSDPAGSPLIAIFTGQYYGGWVKEHAAYLAATIDANTQQDPAGGAGGDPLDEIPFAP